METFLVVFTLIVTGYYSIDVHCKVDHSTHFHYQEDEQTAGHILPDYSDKLDSPKVFKTENGEFIEYDQIWQKNDPRDTNHRRHSRHRGLKKDEQQDRNIDKDMLIYVVILVCLLCPYGGMVICRYFCPQVVEGAVNKNAALAQQLELERQRKEAGKRAKELRDRGIVEIDLSKRKKERGSRGSKLLKKGGPRTSRKTRVLEPDFVVKDEVSPAESHRLHNLRKFAFVQSRNQKLHKLPQDWSCGDVSVQPGQSPTTRPESSELIKFKMYPTISTKYANSSDGDDENEKELIRCFDTNMKKCAQSFGTRKSLAKYRLTSSGLGPANIV